MNDKIINGTYRYIKIVFRSKIGDSSAKYFKKTSEVFIINISSEIETIVCERNRGWSPKNEPVLNAPLGHHQEMNN